MDDDSISTGHIIPAGYKLKHVLRMYNTGGGVAIIYKSGFMTWQLENKDIRIDESISQQWHSISLSPCRLSPSTKHQKGFTTSKFLVEFADLMDTVAMDMLNMLIAGDFNLHMDNESNNDMKCFVDILKAADLTQQVEDPIHAAGHTIDLLITCSSDEFLKNNK